MGEVSGDVERGSIVKYPYLECFIISGFKDRTRRDSRDRMWERRCDQCYAMIILLVDGKISTMRNDVPSGCRRRCRTGRVIPSGLESIAELVSVTLMRVVVLLAIGVLVTLGRFCFPRTSEVGFLTVLLLIGGFVDFMRASVESLAIAGEVSGTRKLKKTTANINISKRVLQWKVVNDIVHGRRKRHEKVSCFSFIGL